MKSLLKILALSSLFTLHYDESSAGRGTKWGKFPQKTSSNEGTKTKSPSVIKKTDSASMSSSVESEPKPKGKDSVKTHQSKSKHRENVESQPTEVAIDLEQPINTMASSSSSANDSAIRDEEQAVDQPATVTAAQEIDDREKEDRERRSDELMDDLERAIASSAYQRDEIDSKLPSGQTSIWRHAVIDAALAKRRVAETMLNNEAKSALDANSIQVVNRYITTLPSITGETSINWQTLQAEYIKISRLYTIISCATDSKQSTEIGQPSDERISAILSPIDPDTATDSTSSSDTSTPSTSEIPNASPVESQAAVVEEASKQITDESGPAIVSLADPNITIDSTSSSDISTPSTSEALDPLQVELQAVVAEEASNQITNDRKSTMVSPTDLNTATNSPSSSYILTPSISEALDPLQAELQAVVAEEASNQSGPGFFARYVYNPLADARFNCFKDPKIEAKKFPLMNFSTLQEILKSQEVPVDITQYNFRYTFSEVYWQFNFIQWGTRDSEKNDPMFNDVSRKSLHDLDTIVFKRFLSNLIKSPENNGIDFFIIRAQSAEREDGQTFCRYNWNNDHYFIKFGLLRMHNPSLSMNAYFTEIPEVVQGVSTVSNRNSIKLDDDFGMIS